MGYCFCVYQQSKDSAVLTDVKSLYIDDLCVDENMTVHINKDDNLPDAKTIEELAAAKLSIIFQDIPVQTVFRLLGVKSI